MKLADVKQILAESNNILDWADPEFAEQFEDVNSDMFLDEVVLDQQHVNSDNEIDPTLAGFEYVGSLRSPEGTYRPGAEEAEVWIAPNGHLAIREILTGDNDDRMMIMKWKSNDLSKVFVKIQ